MRIREWAPADGEVVRAIVTGTLAEFGFAVETGGTDADLDDIAAAYGHRGGCFRVLVDEDDRIVGCGGLYPLSGGDVELRKMYFLPEARGRGFGKLLLNDLIERARTAGYDRIVLETASNLQAAIHLYEAAGFTETHEPKHACRCDRTFMLPLR